MGSAQMEQKSAVDCGYWHLWRYDPRLEEEGRNPFQLDSKEPEWSKFKDFLLGEVRYTQLIKSFPKQADELFEAAKESAQWRYRSYQRMAAAQFGDMPASEVAVAAEGEN
jgi:pyruvate-ferredoxin/flavodoxin oxidoreductase